MIREMAHITVKPGAQADFEAGVQKALPLFQRARGFHRLELHHIIEHPEQYVLQIHWQTLEDHMKHFRESEDFQAWRGIVGGFFAKAPDVVHTEVVVGE
ncbi:MAG: antibiotic biosynthesis monooxygenase family protein [Castellaniella sp.]|uniref:antibiotic biosynthesis monooxygenase family protein n=1 Tax=Castellaniella sp. TaxID=1955812 RepID=UPI003C787588